MYSRSAAVPAGVCCLGNPPATNLFPHTHTLPAIEKQNTAALMNKDSLNKKKERGRNQEEGRRKRGVKEGEGNEKERKKREGRRGKMVDVEEEKREVESTK